MYRTDDSTQLLTPSTMYRNVVLDSLMTFYRDQLKTKRVALLSVSRCNSIHMMGGRSDLRTNLTQDGSFCHVCRTNVSSLEISRRQHKH